MPVDPNPDLTTSLTPELVKSMPRETLERFLGILLKSQTISLENLREMAGLLAKANERIKQLQDHAQSQEAELLVLRNRP